MTRPDYAEKIPNNVGLAEDRRLQRALESWQPDFLSWWETMGPTLPTQDVYLRTAIDVRGEGWATFGHVPMIDYRWGIFLADRNADRRIAFGQHKGEPAWQNWIFYRPNASGPDGALRAYGTGKRADFDRKRV